MTKRRKRWLWASAAIVVVVVPLVIAARLWFGAIVVSETRTSPDGKFEASASNVNEGTIRGDRARYIQVQVVEVSTGRVICWYIHHHAPDASVPDYGKRGVKFVLWSQDSDSVTIPVANGQELKLSVP